jgi:hypothetical protein
MRTAVELALRDDEIAIAFQGVQGLRAEDLGRFLQRAGAETRRNGVELRIVGFEPGSLLVRCKALGVKVTRNAKKEALENPIRTTLGTAAVAIAAAALANGMSADEERPTPLASEGARIVQQHGVREINVITVDEMMVVMTPYEARRISDSVRRRGKAAKRSPLQELSSALRDSARGQVFLVAGTLHFQPEGHQFTVPIRFGYGYEGPELQEFQWYSVSGVLRTRLGQPESMEIAQATPL